MYTDEAGVNKIIAQAFPNGIVSNSVPNSTQLLALIGETSSEIDIVLSSVGYTTPVSAPTAAVNYLKLVCEYGVAAEVIKIAFPEAQTQNNNTAVLGAGDFWEKRYQNALDRLLSRDLVLVGVDMGNSSLASTYLTDNPDNDPFEDGFTDGQQPVFSMSDRLRDF